MSDTRASIHLKVAAASHRAVNACSTAARRALAQDEHSNLRYTPQLAEHQVNIIGEQHAPYWAANCPMLRLPSGGCSAALHCRSKSPRGAAVEVFVARCSLS